MDSSRTDDTGGDAQPSRALAALEALSARAPSVATLLTPREGAFMRLSDDGSNDEESRGRIVSEGWRATKESRFDELGARLPDTADGVMDVGVSRFDRLRVRVKLEEAGASPASVREGRVVYTNVLPSTDRVVASDAHRLEEVLVLHDERAPRTFIWNVQRPVATRVIERNGGMRFVDTRGRTVVAMSAPLAYDANGARVSLRVAWNEAASTLTLALPEGPLAFPVVVDPDYETSVWFDVASLEPETRDDAATVFDSVRGEIVVFGGSINGARTSDTWTWNGTRWTEHFPLVAPSPRDGHAMVFDAARGQAVLFGGDGPGAVLGDTWTWDGSSWTRRIPAATPSPRYGSALAFDAARSQVVLVGGESGTETFADTWTWDGTTWTDRSPASSPPRRSHATLTFDAPRGQLVMFGGIGTSARDDTWLWNGTTWTERVLAVRPSARWAHAAAFDAARTQVTLFGGYTGTTALDDTWTWDGSGWTLRSPATRPPPHSTHGLAYDSVRAQVVLFGGGALGGSDDLWTWNGTIWSQKTAPPPPPKRTNHALAFDAARGKTLLFGGDLYNGTYFDDTWTWDGAAWTALTLATRPQKRSEHALAFDVTRGNVVMFGGFDNGSVLRDTWVWDGAGWTRRLPATSPSARFGHAMTFDSVRTEVVLFGGQQDDDALKDDTWVWNGTTWTRRLPASSPPARTEHAIAFDSARAEALVFGGLSAMDFLNDTWAWDGTTWAQRTSAKKPSRRRSHAMGFDSVRGQIILYGGWNDVVPFSDTWAWNGAAWNQRAPRAIPDAVGRTGHALAFDSARAQIVLFGGDANDGDVRNDTWLHVTLGGSCVTSSDCLDSSCVDGVCCDAPSCGACRTCAGTSPGRCAPVSNREDADTCAARDGKSCDDLGECKTALGAPATRAADCASGFVVDGVCCATATCPRCEACSPALKERADEVPGVCTATKTGTDPRSDCESQDVSTCGTNGQCDGNRNCAFYPVGTECGPAGAMCSGAGSAFFRRKRRATAITPWSPATVRRPIARRSGAKATRAKRRACARPTARETTTVLRTGSASRSQERDRPPADARFRNARAAKASPSS